MRDRQKSVQRPLTSQSPYRVGSGPFGPPISVGRGAVGSVGASADGGAGAGVGLVSVGPVMPLR